MKKPLFGLQKNNWVKVMMPNTMRKHCLAVVDAEFAHTYCGKILRIGDLVGVDDHDQSRRCPSCSKNIPNYEHTTRK